ncbi:mitochondrial distribution and morphology protein 10 [Phanerochaete sordida]|uniref:Mitochondrial distribution and morphology protein 10 n=1 Tax=Phanerochaete sordida TaxID=48140 RepID=A0A9P3FWJ0_9APHY|nr:mitochondrial distribution and morphology protein 10 [Phanerochaete sordida]
MHPFATYVIRSYYKATGWSEDDFYAHITRSSNAILDFDVPTGLKFAISKSPNPLFKTSYSMSALPSLHGSIGYIFTSCDLDIKSSGNVRVKDMIDRFRVYDQPRRPEGKEEEWLAGERVDTRDYLMYGRIYVPTGRLEAIYTTRLGPTLQALVAAISDPRYSLQSSERYRSGASPSNVLVKLQHSTGRWCTEYSWSAEDQMWGVQCMHNFGKLGTSASHDAPDDASKEKPKRVDEEDAMEGGLKGRISAGAEFYLSTKEKSAGVSAGIRFTTLPDATPPSAQIPQPPNGATPLPNPPSQPPTTITAMFNPMLGHMSGAYAARVSRDLSLCSRFDFNVYSYESEWSLGAEWWMRRHKPKAEAPVVPDLSSPSLPLVVTPVQPPPLPVVQDDEIQGVVKARASTTTDVSLMWEGRIRNLLVSLGITSNLSSRAKPIKAVGLEISYFSSE